MRLRRVAWAPVLALGLVPACKDEPEPSAKPETVASPAAKPDELGKATTVAGPLRLEGLSRPEGAPFWVSAVELRSSVEDGATLLTVVPTVQIEQADVGRGDVAIEALCKLSGRTFVGRNSVRKVRRGKLIKHDRPPWVSFRTAQAPELPDACQVSFMTYALHEDADSPFHEAGFVTCWNGSEPLAEPCKGYPADPWLGDDEISGTDVTTESVDVSAVFIEPVQRGRDTSWSLRVRLDVTSRQVLPAEAGIRASATCGGGAVKTKDLYLGIGGPFLSRLRPGVSLTLDAKASFEPPQTAAPAECEVELRIADRYGDGTGVTLGRWCGSGVATKPC